MRSLDEMTMRAGRLNDRVAQQIVDANKDTWYQSARIGEIAQYDLRLSDKMYSLWDGDQYVASARLEDSDRMGMSEVNLLHVDAKYREQKILSRLLWNFKSRQNRKQLVLNQIHSDDLYSIIVGGGLSRFEKFWIDQSGQTKPFDNNTINQFYSHGGPTGWRLVLENSYDLSFFPKFSPGTNWLLEDYSWQIE